MLKEFFRDLKIFEKESKWMGFKWMKFDFYFLQPVLLFWSIKRYVAYLPYTSGRIGKIYFMTDTIILIIGLLLLYLTFLRKKCSYFCWIALHVVKVLYRIACMNLWEISLWSIIFDVIYVMIIAIYYEKRRNFFYKEREEGDKGKKRGLVIGGFMSALIIIFTATLFLYVLHKGYMEKPAKTMEYIASNTQNIWTDEQAEREASKWVAAVEEKNTEEIQKMIEEIYTVRENPNARGFLFLKQTEFQAGIDQEKSDRILSYIDAGKHGMAYYSLARISHYYDARTSKNHETEVLADEKEDGIFVTLRHGRSNTEIAFVDMNEVIGEAGKENFYALKFPEEKIVSLLSDIYTDEDISFVKKLSEAAGEGEYVQLFQNNPDKLSAYGQDALYIYAYALMDSCMEYDTHLKLTGENCKPLENFVNDILFIRSNSNKKYYCERYLKILEDKGKVHMDGVADQLRQYYDQKEMVISLLPDFAINSELNILFHVFKFYLNYEEGISYTKTIQVEGLEFDDLLYGAFQCRLNVDGGNDIPIELSKLTSDSAARYSLIESYRYLKKYMSKARRFEPDREDIDCFWYGLYGDVIVDEYHGVVMAGEHDANAILKLAKLEKEGMAKILGVSDERRQEVADSFMEDINKYQNIDTQKKLYIAYLIWTGEPNPDVNDEPYSIQSFDEITYPEIDIQIGDNWIDYYNYNILVNDYFDDIEEDEPFNYFSYDMINDYYLKSKEDEEESDSTATKEEIPEEVTEEDTAQQEEKEDSSKVEGYEYLKQIDLASADGNVYPVMVPRDFVLEEGDRFVIYLDNGFGLSMYARELFEGETLTDFMDTISNFIYEDPDRNFVNVNKTDQIEKDGLIYQICTADGLHSDGTTSPHARLAAAIPLGGTDVLAFHLEYASYTYNREGNKYLEEIGKYYKIPVDLFIELMEEN